MTTQKQTLVRKSVAILFYILAAVAFIFLIKTELRKWFFFGGEASSANTAVFWGSLIFGLLFCYLGNKIWPNEASDKNE